MLSEEAGPLRIGYDQSQKRQGKYGESNLVRLNDAPKYQAQCTYMQRPSNLPRRALHISATGHAAIRNKSYVILFTGVWACTPAIVTCTIQHCALLWVACQKCFQKAHTDSFEKECIIIEIVLYEQYFPLPFFTSSLHHHIQCALSMVKYQQSANFIKQNQYSRPHPCLETRLLLRPRCYPKTVLHP